MLIVLVFYNMAVSNLENDVVMAGCRENPRVVWFMDRVGGPAVEKPEIYGLRKDELLVQFRDGRLGKVREFLEANAAKYASVEVAVFLFLGMDDLAEDAPSAPLSATIEEYFHVRGPRQFPRDDVAAVVASYTALVDAALSLLPSAIVISSNPAPRRSGGGFAVTRAIQVTAQLTRRGRRHHHFSVLRKFYGRRLSAALDVQGGRNPVYEKYFESDGVHLTLPALCGVVIRARSFFNCFVEDSAPSDDPTAIAELKCLF